MDTVLYVLGLAVSGLVVGALARLALPGRDPMSVFQTMLVGVAGSLIAGLVTFYAFDRSEGPGFLLAFLCTLVLVFAVRKLRERQLGPSAPATQSPLAGGSGMQVRFMPGCLIGSLVISLGLTLLLNLLIRAF
jgi:uncharacterized membrane protein YeaQ/YmgE (transglycosylase-associated protein family)